MKRITSIVSIMILLAGSVYAGGKDITLAGSTTVYPVAQRCAEVYMDKNSDINITVRGGGSGIGIAAIVKGKIDIANSSRPIKTKELKQARENGINPVASIICKDGIAVAVNPKNSIEKLTLSQLNRIYSGEIDNWKSVGGSNMAIVVISRDTSSGTYEVFQEKALQGKKVVKGALMLASNKAIATTVAQTPGAIGYVGFGFLSDEIKILPIDDVKPSKETVNNNSYKLSRSLYMYTNGKPKDAVKAFIDFILSPEGQKIAEEQGYIPIK